MNRLTLRLASLVMLLALTGVLAFAGGFQLNEHGARAMAQGGAWVARAYDVSSIYFNPAGLTNVQNLEVMAGTTFIIPAITFYGPRQLNSNAPTEMVSQTFTPVNAYVGYKLMNKLAVGIGVNNPFGLGTEWKSDWVGRYLTQKIDLQTWFISPTVAYELMDGLSLGVGVNYVTGTVKLKQAVPIPFNSPEPQISMNLDASSAFGYNAGVLWQATPKISFGASYRTSVKIDASGPATFAPDYALLPLPRGNVKASLTLPATGYVGVAYKAMSNFELEADYQYVGWSSYKELVFHFADGSTETAPKNYQDTYIIRVGGEYTWEKFQFRAGYLYDHSPVQTAYVDPLLPDANRNGINLGLGYKLTSALTIDVSYLYLKFDQRTATGTVVNFDGVYNSYAHLIGIDFGYSF